jgi:hypothetical protein
MDMKSPQISGTEISIGKLATRETDERLEWSNHVPNPKPESRSFFSSTVSQFLATDPNAIVGRLSSLA